MFALEYIALIDSAPVSELTAQWNGCVHAWCGTLMPSPQSSTSVYVVTCIWNVAALLQQSTSKLMELYESGMYHT